MKLLTKIKTAALAVAISTAGTVAFADYPEKPINLIVGFGAGGGVDVFARTVAIAAEEILGVPVAVVNKPGAASINGARQVSGSRPDGYTLLMTNGTTLASALALQGDKAGLDMNADLDTIGTVGILTTGLLVPADSPFQTANDLVEAAKADPGSLRWSHPGRGAFHMLAGAAFLGSNGITAQDVPFKGGGKARNAISGGQVDFGFMGVQLVSGFEDTVRAIGVTSKVRDAIFSDVPTFEEQGLPQMNLSGPIAIYAPAGMPDEIKTALVDAFKAAAESDAYLSRAEEAGLATGYMTPEDTDALVANVVEMLDTVIQEVAASR